MQSQVESELSSMTSNSRRGCDVIDLRTPEGEEPVQIHHMPVRADPSLLDDDDGYDDVHEEGAFKDGKMDGQLRPKVLYQQPATQCKHKHHACSFK